MEKKTLERKLGVGFKAEDCELCVGRLGATWDLNTADVNSSNATYRFKLNVF